MLHCAITLLYSIDSRLPRPQAGAPHRRNCDLRFGPVRPAHRAVRMHRERAAEHAAGGWDRPRCR